MKSEEEIVAVPSVETLVKRINRKSWWYVLPLDPDAYKKRGKFYSSSFEEAEFYGRSGDAERVTVVRPLCGDEVHIETVLLGECPSIEFVNLQDRKVLLAARFVLDKRMKKAAVRAGYDAIALMTPKAWVKFLEEGKLPRSIELNVFS